MNGHYDATPDFLWYIEKGENSVVKGNLTTTVLSHLDSSVDWMHSVAGKSVERWLCHRRSEC